MRGPAVRKKMFFPLPLVRRHRFFRSRWWIDVDFNCLGALPGAPGPPKSIFCFHKDIFGDSPGAPGTARVASKAPPSHSRHALGRHWASREDPGIDFDSILDAPKALPGSILDRFLRRAFWGSSWKILRGCLGISCDSDAARLINWDASGCPTNLGQHSPKGLGLLLSDIA